MSRVATMSQSSIVAAAGNIARYVQDGLTTNVPLLSLIHSPYGKVRLFFSVLLNLSLFCRTIDRSVFKPIVQISVIDRSESTDCHLLAVTHAGKGCRTV